MELKNTILRWLLNMDDSQKIDRLIEIMKDLKILCKELENPYCNETLTLGLIVALIKTTKIPNVTILPNYKEMALA